MKRRRRPYWQLMRGAAPWAWPSAPGHYPTGESWVSWSLALPGPIGLMLGLNSDRELVLQTLASAQRGSGGVVSEHEFNDLGPEPLKMPCRWELLPPARVVDWVLLAIPRQGVPLAPKLLRAGPAYWARE